MAAGSNPKLQAVNFLSVFTSLMMPLSLSDMAPFPDVDNCSLKTEKATSFCKDTSLSFLPPPYRIQKFLNCSCAWNGSVYFKYIQNSHNICSILLKSDGFSGWIGIGFLKDGRKTVSTTAVGWTGGHDKHNKNVGPGIMVVSGIQIFLRAKATEKIRSNAGDFYFVDVPAFVKWDNKTFYMGFQAKMNASLGEQDMILVKNEGAQPTVKNNAFLELTNPTHRYVAKVNFTREYNPSKECSSNDNFSETRHGMTGLFAWGVFLPVGTIIPRYFKNNSPKLFSLFKAIGLLLCFSTVQIGRRLYSELDCQNDCLKIHRQVGITLLWASIFQATELIVPPKKAANWRKYWNWFHYCVGRLILFFGVLNLVLGGVLFSEGKWNTALIGYGSFVFFIIVIVTIFEAAFALRAA